MYALIENRITNKEFWKGIRQNNVHIHNKSQLNAAYGTNFPLFWELILQLQHLCWISNENIGMTKMILKRKYSADKEIRRPIFSKRNSKIRSFAECPLKNRLFIKIHKVKVYLLHECAPPSFFVAAADDGFQENTFLPFENCNKI